MFIHSLTMETIEKDIPNNFTIAEEFVIVTITENIVMNVKRKDDIFSNKNILEEYVIKKILQFHLKFVNIIYFISHAIYCYYKLFFDHLI